MIFQFTTTADCAASSSRNFLYDETGQLWLPNGLGGHYRSGIGTPVIVSPLTSGVGIVLTASLQDNWTVTGWQWRRVASGVDSPISGATSATYTQVSVDVAVGTRVYPQPLGLNYIGGTTSDTGVIAGSTNRAPRYGYAPDAPGNLLTLLSGMTLMTGAANGSLSAAFDPNPGFGQYTWIAIEKSVHDAMDGVQLFDGIGTGGWSGAGLTGDNMGASEAPRSHSTMVATDANGVIWVFLRQDFNQASGAFTVS